MCAAPGGKTTALAQLMGDRGEVVALDRSHRKARSPPVTHEPKPRPHPDMPALFPCKGAQQGKRAAFLGQ